MPYDDLPAPDLLAAVEKSLRDRDAGRATREVSLPVQAHPWDRNKVHASDLGKLDPEDGCRRQLWGRVHGWQGRPAGLGKLLMWDNAYGVHERIALHLAYGLPEQGWHVTKVEEQVEAEGEGRLDLLVEQMGVFAEDGCLPLRVVVDIKSVRGRKFKFLHGPMNSHVAQVQAYLRAEQADYGIVLYVDREGQNGLRQFAVGRDDETTAARWAEAHEVAALPEPPPVLPPKLERRANKGPDTLTLDLPWQCEYCEFCDVECPGALPPEKRGRKAKAKGDVLVEVEQDVETLLQEMLGAGSLSGQAERWGS